MKKLQSGYYAVITGAFTNTEDIGREVELLVYVPPGESLFFRDGYFDGDATGAWIVKGANLVRNVVDGERRDTIAAYAPEHLLFRRADCLRQRTKVA